MFTTTLCFLILVPALTAYSMERHQQKSNISFAGKEGDTVSYHIYLSPAQALKKILNEAKPRVIGFGEYHQQEETADIASSLKRFTDLLVPILAAQTSDLIVETWITGGECGDAEKEVVSGVEETTKRPKTTEDEIVILIKKAQKLGIQPHILEMACEDYKKLKQTDGEVDYSALMVLIARQMEEKCKTILDSRTMESMMGVNGQKSINPSKLIAIYGGAMHNDIFPDEEWKTVSFGPKIQKMVNGRYIEVDIYVPEFIANDETIQEQDWFPIFRQYAATDKVLLIKPRENRYIIVLRKGVLN